MTEQGVDLSQQSVEIESDGDHKSEFEEVLREETESMSSWRVDFVCKKLDEFEARLNKLLLGPNGIRPSDNGSNPHEPTDR